MRPGDRVRHMETGQEATVFWSRAWDERAVRYDSGNVSSIDPRFAYKWETISDEGDES